MAESCPHGLNMARCDECRIEFLKLPRQEQRTLERIARSQERQRKRAHKEAKRALQPELQNLQPNDDPLLVYDRLKRPIGHALRNHWSPCSAFLVCSGPSLAKVDVSLLKNRGVCSLGVNNAAAFAPVKAMTFSDPPEKFHSSVLLDPGIMKLIPKSKLDHRFRARDDTGKLQYTSLAVHHCPNVFAYSRDSVWEPENFFSRPHASWGSGEGCPRQAAKSQPKILFTFFLGLRLLYYMGVRRVYLLGVDFAMEPCESGGYAFNQERSFSAAACNNAYYRTASKMLEELQEGVFSKVGFEVFNCNERSHLSVFPYVPFEDAMEDCTRYIDPEPLDCSGYYDKPAIDGKGDDRGE